MNYHEKVSRHLGVDIPYFPLDGKIHRFSSDKTTKKPLWAIGNEWVYKGNVYWSVTCGDFRNEYTKIKFTSYDNHDGATSKYFDKIAKQKQAEIAVKIENEKRQIQETCRVESTAKLKNLKTANTHSYLERKKIKPFNSKLDGNLLIIPAYDELGIVGHQYITGEGKKWFSTGIKIKGAICPLKEIKNSEMIYVTEGFATAASIQMATNYPVVACFTANNIVNSIVTIAKINPDAFIVICADRDKLNEQTGKRTGEHYANDAQSRFKNSKVIFPWDDLHRIGDFNDLHCQDGLDAVSERVYVDIKELKETTRKRIIETGFSYYDEKGRVQRDHEALLKFLISETHYFYVPEMGTAFIFNGKYYEKAPDDFFKNFAQKYFDPFCDKVNQINEFVSLAKRYKIVKAKDVKDKKSKNYIPFTNGLLNFVTNDFIPHTPRIKVYHLIPWDYRPEADSPTFNLVLNNITKNRKHLINQLLEFMGWTISGIGYEYHQKFLILAGGGKNGKSTFINIFNMLLGDENISAIELASIANNRFASSVFNNSLLNTSEEEHKKCFQETGMLKKITGHSAIQVEEKFKPSFKTINKTKIMISYNEMPFIHDLSYGMRRRMLIVPFDVDFRFEPNKKIENVYEKIENEMSGIINMALYGLKRLIQNKDFTESQENEEKINEMIRESNPIVEWFEECLIVDIDKQYSESIERLYASFIQYVGSDTTIKKMTFSKKLLSMLRQKDDRFTSKLVKSNGIVSRSISGVTLGDKSNSLSD